MKVTADKIIKAPPHVPTTQGRGRAADALAFKLRRDGWPAAMNDFRRLQEQRHNADYDLSYRVHLQATRAAHAQATSTCAIFP